MHLAQDQHHNDRLVRDLLKHAYGDTTPTLEELIKDGLIAGSNLAEVAISKKSGIELCPVGIKRDLVDDTDVKTITVQEKYFYKTKNGKATKIKVPRFQAVVKDAHKKIGLLRVVCYNPFSGRYHYFMIPASGYYGVKNITIAFDKETQEPIGKFREFLSLSFDDVCRDLTLREKVDQIICNVGKDNVVESIDSVMNLFSNAIKDFDFEK